MALLNIHKATVQGGKCLVDTRGQRSSWSERIGDHRKATGVLTVPTLRQRLRINTPTGCFMRYQVVTGVPNKVAAQTADTINAVI